jgi:hypothetical protein
MSLAALMMRSGLGGSSHRHLDDDPATKAGLAAYPGASGIGVTPDMLAAWSARQPLTRSNQLFRLRLKGFAKILRHSRKHLC